MSNEKRKKKKRESVQFLTTELVHRMNSVHTQYTPQVVAVYWSISPFRTVFLLFHLRLSEPYESDAIDNML